MEVAQTWKVRPPPSEAAHEDWQVSPVLLPQHTWPPVQSAALAHATV
jgi:hypothetical protein